MPSESGKTVLVTGASRGIGLAVTRQLLAQGQRVIGMGRTSFRDLDIAGLNSDDYLRCNLTNPDSLKSAVDLLQSRVDTLDCVIHNAALGYFGQIEEQNDLDALIGTNICGPILLTRFLSELLLRSKESRVVFISSLHSRLPTARFAAYTASKRTIEGFARNLKEEWRGRVDVQVLYPGATTTNMHRSAGMSAREIEKINSLPADEVARHIVAAIGGRPQSGALRIRDSIFRAITIVARPAIDRLASVVR